MTTTNAPAATRGQQWPDGANSGGSKPLTWCATHNVQYSGSSCPRCK